MEECALILDLDGVLISTPHWQPDELDHDGYSAFDFVPRVNLNELLDAGNFIIYLSSTRRKGRTLEEFNGIFSFRGIKGKIKEFVPVYDDCKTRKEELERFIEEKGLDNFIIIDDDKTLHELKPEYKSRLVHTEYIKGFNGEKLDEALSLIGKAR